MFVSRALRFPRKPFAELDYARHMPAEYVERTKRTVPRKVFGGRFGAPPVTRWFMHPEDYVPSHNRPWTNEALTKNIERVDRYHQAKLSNKFFEFRRPRTERIADEKWTFFVGDLVEVMVGKDKGRQGTVLQVSRDTNEILVEGLHCKLEEEMEGAEKLGVQRSMRWKEQPLRVDKGHVMLVDPNDGAPCTAEWKLNGGETEYLRISEKTGFEIPIPSQAKVTYEYQVPEKYIEVEDKDGLPGKDTPAKLVLERTYVPKLCSFEEEILENMGIKETRQNKPTYWY